MKLKLFTKKDFRKLLESEFKTLEFKIGECPYKGKDALPFKQITKDIFNMIRNTLVIDDFKLIKAVSYQVYVKDNIRCTCDKNNILIHKY